MVIWNPPSGTANFQFKNFPPYNVAGKTGTAENPLGKSHAWFAGYSYEEDPRPAGYCRSRYSRKRG